LIGACDRRIVIAISMIAKINTRQAWRTVCGCLLMLALVSGCAPSAVRILPVGDSISVGYTDNPAWSVPFEFGYRGALFEMFQEAGVSVQFVGTSPEPWNGQWGIPTNQPSPDLRQIGQDHHEAYGGKNSAFVAEHIGAWVRKTKPDFVLLMIGINDIPPGSTNFPPAIETNLQAILQTVMDVRPATHVIIAQTTPYVQSTSGIVAFNRFIREKLVPDFVARGARVSTVDQFANFVSDSNGSAGEPSLYSNGLNHPNPKGYQRMAQTWFNEIQRQRSPAPVKKSEK
jgi:lysophospholipase L1-like esterase